MEENSIHQNIEDIAEVNFLDNSINENQQTLSASDQENRNEIKPRKRNNTQTLSVSKILPLYHRSNSLSIPMNRDNLNNVDNFYSKSCSITENQVQSNYGATINNSEQNLSKPLDFYDVFDEKENKSIDLEASTDTENSTEGKKVGFFKSLTPRQKKVFLTLVFLSLNDTLGFALMSTFFPVVANDKGLTALHIGLIFSAYSVFGMISGLAVGTVLVRVGAKFCILSGMFLGIGSMICFGFLNLMGAVPFLMIGIASRGLMGFGSNMAYTAMFAVVFQEFGDRSITVLSLSEALVGVGGMTGPLIGAALYEAGGFVTPFLVMGGIQIILFIICYFLIPFVPIDASDKNISPFSLLQHSCAIVASLTIVLVFIINSFISANMSNFLSDVFKMNAVMAGVIFLVMSIFYAGLSPIWGYIADRWKQSYIIEAGLTMMGIGLIFLGPASVLKHLFNWSEQQLWLLFVASIILGSSFGAAAMPTFTEMITAAEELKLKENMLAQYGLVSGLWNSMFSLGDILGPSLGGVMVTRYGFEDSSAIIGMSCIALVFLRFLQRFLRNRKLKMKKLNSDSDSDETRPLINSINS